MYRAAVVVVGLLAVFSVSASAIIDPNLLCPKDSQVVDKDTLAAAALDAGKVRWQFAAWAATSKDRPASLTPAEYLLVHFHTACSQSGVSCDDKQKDSDKLLDAYNAFLTTINDRQYFRSTGSIDGTGYFTDSNSTTQCQPSARNSQDVTKVTTGKERPAIAIRVRGSADDLFVDQNSSTFNTLQKATLSYTDDDVKRKTTRNVTGVVGVAFKLSDDPIDKAENADGYTELVPYAGIASNISETGSSADSVTTNTREVGIAANSYHEQDDFAYVIAVRPQWLWNLPDDSKLFTGSVVFEPISLAVLNSKIELSDDLAYQWILDARYNHGQYTSLGSRSESTSQDFDRLGGRMGASLAHGGTVLPWTWTVTETWFHSIDGQYNSLGLFSSVVSFALDPPKQYVGIDLTYNDGRDGLTAVRDKMWMVSLGVRY
jgi:hypothetical protein